MSDAPRFVKQEILEAIRGDVARRTGDGASGGQAHRREASRAPVQRDESARWLHAAQQLAPRGAAARRR